MIAKHATVRIKKTEMLPIENGYLVERVYYNWSGNEKDRIYWVVRNGELINIEQDAVEDDLTNFEAYYPRPETYECRACGRGFEPEHGVAVPNSRVQSDVCDEEAVTKAGTEPESAPIALTDGGYERDKEAVIAVDWASVDVETETEIPDDLRHTIEREGNANRYTLDKYGYEEMATSALHNAVKSHSQIIHPERGPINENYLTVSRPITSTIQAISYGRNRNLSEPAEVIDGDETGYLDGLGTLVDAAKAIDTQRDDWYTPPKVMMGSYGPDQLGSLYIRVAHTSEDVLREINSEGLGVELECINHWGDRPHDGDFKEHYGAIYRHKRYADDGEDEENEYTEEAAEIGLIGSNLGTRTSIVSTISERGYDYEELDQLVVRGQRVWVYEYDHDEGTRWAVEWGDRVAIDEVKYLSLIFNERPDADDVSRAALIEEARLGDNDQC